MKREVMRCLRGEKENRKSQLYKDMLRFKREFLAPLLAMHDRLNGQTFVRFIDESIFFNKLDKTLRLFKDLIDFYSVPPESNTSIALSDL